MPEVHFTIQLPGGDTRQCYSPSSVIRKFFAAGDEMPASEFLARSREALQIASERVRAKYGFDCAAAGSQLQAIEQWCASIPADSPVRILNI